MTKINPKIASIAKNIVEVRGNVRFQEFVFKGKEYFAGKLTSLHNITFPPQSEQIARAFTQDEEKQAAELITRLKLFFNIILEHCKTESIAMQTQFCLIQASGRKLV